MSSIADLARELDSKAVTVAGRAMTMRALPASTRRRIAWQYPEPKPKAALIRPGPDDAGPAADLLDPGWRACVEHRHWVILCVTLGVSLSLSGPDGDDDVWRFNFGPPRPPGPVDPISQSGPAVSWMEQYASALGGAMTEAEIMDLWSQYLALENGLGSPQVALGKSSDGRPTNSSAPSPPSNSADNGRGPSAPDCSGSANDSVRTRSSGRTDSNQIPARSS